MKKYVVAFLMLGAVVCSLILTACSSTSQLEKVEAREGKVVLDGLKKGGWEMNDISRSLELAVLRHIEKLKDPANQSVTATATCRIMSNCDLAARTEVARKYGQQAALFLRERIVGDNNFDQSNPDSEFAKLYSGYEGLVQKEINGEIILSYDVVRKAQNNTKEYKAFYIINEEKASKARLRAMEQAFKETTAAQKYASQIADFVKQGFKLKMDE